MSTENLNKDEPKTKAISIAAIMTSLPSAPVSASDIVGKFSLDSNGHDLLTDPTLVENYSDILKQKPNRFSSVGIANGGNETDNDSESASGSVVLTRTSANSSPSKHRASMLSNTSSHYSLRLGHDTLHELEREEMVREEDGDDEKDDDEGKDQDREEEKLNGHAKVEKDPDAEVTMDMEFRAMTNSPTGDATHDYDYSDSDFEDNIEKRLQSMDDNVSSTDDADRKADESDSENLVLGLSLSEDDNSDSDDQLKSEKDQGAFEIEAGSDSDSDEYQPLSPPKELDPEKLYALYAFNGPDPSHCQLKQDESCTLLNDQDSYWWLVKRSNDSKIGFAPAEILETFPERLARLNCWKNENISSRLADADESIPRDHKEEEENVVSSQDEFSDEQEGGKRHGSSILKDYVKDNKSVSFNDVVSYADRFIEENVDTANNSDARHYDEFSEANLKLNNLAEDDEISEIVSDVSFNTASMTPLNIQKVRRPKVEPNELNRDAVKTEDATAAIKPKEETNIEEGLKDEGDDLRKIFEAPTLPFGKNSSRSGPQMQNSNSDYSISTIGDFSPSSSEWTNESPQLQSEQFKVQDAAIPPSRAIQDFSKYVEEETIVGDTTSENISVDSKSCHDSISKVESDGLRTNKRSSLESSSSSSERIFMDSERIASFTSINSTSSVNKQLSHVKNNLDHPAGKHHPLIDQLYNPVFDKMSDLMRQLDNIVDG